METHALAIVTALLTISANGLAAILFWRMKRMDSDIEMLKEDINAVRLNYINRFQDVKDHNTVLHLQLIEKIAILDKTLAAYTATITAKTTYKKEKE